MRTTLASATFLFLSAQIAQADIAEPSLSIQLSSDNKQIEARVTRYAAFDEECKITLSVAETRQGVLRQKGSTSVVLKKVSDTAVETVFIAEKLPRIKRTGKRTLKAFGRVALQCPSGSARSTPQQFRIGTARRGVSFGEWVSQVKKRISAVKPGLTRVFANSSFTKPLDLQHAKDGSGRVFVVEQGGKIWSLDTENPEQAPSLFLDISDRVSNTGFERGLLGLAFHPNFKENGYLYVNYTEGEVGTTVIARYQAGDAARTTADKTTELQLLRVEQPFKNHNGGGLAFGPDGFLYIGLGDGGSANDPLGNGQNLSSRLGKMLRIDVDKTENGRNYAIPSTNPYAGNAFGFAEEIFASGLRNPFRFSFDSITGKLWAGDVGQNTLEEIDIIELGKNYGWNVWEASSCFSPPCSEEGYEFPVAEYGRSLGSSVTGGYVYRGSAVPSLEGRYVYADFVSGRVWSLREDVGTYVSQLIVDTEYYISSFGVDETGELYLLSYGDGAVYKFQDTKLN